jgi:hypothetical protein
MSDPSASGAEAYLGGRDSSLLRTAPIGAYVALTALTIILALKGGSLQIVIAPLASSCVFAFGAVMREPDVMFLAWLDQGTNLTLLEAESSAGTVLVVTVSVIAVLLVADIAHAMTSYSPYGGVQGGRQLRQQVPRLLMVGGISCLFALGGLSIAPVLTAPTDPVLVVAALAVAALAAVVAVGSADR